MCESVELARILDVSGTLLKTTCRQNSALASLSIMAKLRLAEKVEPKSPFLQYNHQAFEKRNNLCTHGPDSAEMSSSSESSCSYSSSPESEDCTVYPDLDDLLDSIKGIKIVKSANVGNGNVSKDFEQESETTAARADENSNFFYKRCPLPSDDEISDKDNEDNEDDEAEANDEGLIERGPVRPQLHPQNRSRPYVDTLHWASSGLSQPSENSTDYDTSAKEILTDREYRERIDFCLDKLSDSMISQERSTSNSLSPVHSDFGGASGYSPPQQQQNWQSDGSPGGAPNNNNNSTSGSTCYVPSITICDSESSLLEILSRGGFQPAQSARTPEYTGGATCAASDNCWPDSPASSYNNCNSATSASRPDSRASSRAQSPGSNNGVCGGGGSFLNVLGSPGMESPQVSPQNFRGLYRPPSSSSSSQSYCETPSPANYQSPLDQHLEEQLGEHIMTRLPVWRDSFESSDTIVNSGVDSSSELQLQMVEEIIRGDMNNHDKCGQAANDMQVVPNCNSATSPSHSSSNYTTANGNGQRMASPGSSPYLDNADPTDDLTNTLLRFVGGDKAIDSSKKGADARSNSTTSGYSSGSSSNEAWKACDGSCLQVEQPTKDSFLGISSSPTRHQQQQQTVYQQQCMNMNGTVNMDGLQFSTARVELVGRNSWQNYSEANSVMRNSSSSNNFSDFQIPETVTSYNSQRSKSSNIKCSGASGKSAASNCQGSERSIAPWPSLNLPSTRASERLKEVTDPREVERAMKNLLKKPIEQLAKCDEDGDTMLMCLAGNPRELRKKLAYLAPLVERLGTLEGALASLNSRGEDALYLAAMNCPQMAFVSGYLAAAFLQKNIDIGQRLYRSRGDTLVHALAAKGDAHGEVLAELLSLKTAQGNSVFDLSKRNYDGRTALHVAAEAHDAAGRNSTKTVSIGTTRLLMESGADPTTREVRCGDTALHFAVSLSCDPSLVKALLTIRGSEAVNVANYNGNTPLHMAAVVSERTSLERQSEICWLLMQAGGKTNLTNRQGKTPLALASAERKEPLRRIFHRKT